MTLSKTPDRLQSHLRTYAERYPGAWRQFDAMRADRGMLLPDWPEWCWCPLAGAYAIVSGGGEITLEGAGDVGILGALAAWRITQGVYRFDSDLFQALWDTPLDGKLPVGVLYKLPEWCVYIETPPGQAVEGLLGWFVHLEHDAGTGRAELRLVLDAAITDGPNLLPGIVHLTRPSLDECAEEALAEARQNIKRLGLDVELPENAGDLILGTLTPLISVTLYLCSLAADIVDLRGRRERPENPKPKKTKKGLRIFPQPQTTWLVGYRIGASLRLAEPRETGEPGGGTHASPRPHIRRAHWHAYWTGPRTGQQKLILKWLPPVAVGAGEIVPTIHEVDN